MEISDRVKEIRSSMGMNQAEFSKLLGIGQSTLAMMEVSKRKISERHIKTICSICNISEHWLRTGEGEMHADTDDVLIDNLDAKYNMNEKQKKIIAAFAAMNEKKRETLAEAFFEFINLVSASSETAATIATRPIANDEKLTRAQKESLMHKQLDEEEKGLTSSASITINGSNEDKLA